MAIRRATRGASVAKYTVVVTRDVEDSRYFNAAVPALPGCFTFGKSEAEALANAKEAIEGYVEMLVTLKEPIPKQVRAKDFEINVNEAQAVATASR